MLDVIIRKGGDVFRIIKLLFVTWVCN